METPTAPSGSAGRDGTRSPASQRQSQRRRRSPAVASTVVLFAALGALLVGGPISARGNQTPPGGTISSGAPSTASQARGAPTGAGSGGWTRETRFGRDLQVLLDRHGRAMLVRNKAAFLADVDTRAPAYRQRQARLFDAVAGIPLSVWSYTTLGEGPPLSAGRRAALGADAVTARVEFRHRIAGYDAIEVRHELVLTAVRRSGRWQLAAEGAGPGAPLATGLWDLGTVTVVKGKRSLVLGLGSAPSLRRYAEEADSAVSAVTGVWGRDWPQRVVVVVPKTTRQLAAILGGQPDDYTRIAAVTTGVFNSTARKHSADRVVINPATYPQLRSVGRRVVLTHEVTHVATRAISDGSVPLWLSEGFADYVGYHGAEVPVRVAAADLFDEVRTGRAADPLPLPSDADFHSRTAKLTTAYERAWLACRFIAEEWGQRALIRFYTAVGRSDADASDAVATGLRQVLGTTPARFRSDWQDYVEDHAG
jgi:hypothetical protein